MLSGLEIIRNSGLRKVLDLEVGVSSQQARDLLSATAPILYDSATGVFTHATSGVTPNTYNNVTVNTFGHVTAGSNVPYLTSFTETDPIANAKVITVNSGAGISIAQAAAQTVGSNPVWTIVSTITQYTDALARGAVSLTTNGTTGVSTYNPTTGIFNIPNYTNSVTQYTDEMAQDAVGTILIDSASIDFTYNDVANTITAVVIDSYVRGLLSSGAGISYNSTTGVITSTITQYTDAMARGTISATTPIVYTTATGVISHTVSGVVANTYNNVTVNTFGHVTAGSNVAYLTSFTETDPIANAKTITVNAGAGITIAQAASQTLGANPVWTIVSSITQYTDEQSQDATAALIQNGTGVSWVYNDVGNTLTPTVSLAPFTTTNLAEGSNLYFTDGRARGSISLTTVGTSGVSTYNSVTGVLNVPNYSDANNFPTSLVFSTATGVLTLGRNGLADLTTSLDGRYVTSIAHTHGIANSIGTQQFTFAIGENVRLEGAGSAAITFDAAAKKIVVTGTDTNTTYTGSNGVVLVGTDFQHVDTSTQLSSSNTGRTYIQSITLDTYGHITALATATEIVTQYTDEMAQDAAALLIQNGTGISWVYNDVANTLTPTISLSPFTTANLAEGVNLYYTDGRVRNAISLTTTGISGASIYNATTGVLNVPNYTVTADNGLTKTASNIQLGGALLFNTALTAAYNLSVNDGTVTIGSATDEGSFARLHVTRPAGSFGMAIYGVKSTDPASTDLGIGTRGNRNINSTTFAASSVQAGIYGELGMQNAAGFTFSGGAFVNISGLVGVFTMYANTGNLVSGNTIFTGGAYYGNFAGTGNVDKFAALRVNYPLNTPNQATYTGTITNHYGLYIDDFSLSTLIARITNRYSIYQAGVGETNFYKGNIVFDKLKNGSSTLLLAVDSAGNVITTSAGTGGGTGIGTVTSVDTAAANNGVTATWVGTTTDARLTIGLGAITPTSVSTGTVTGTSATFKNIALNDVVGTDRSVYYYTSGVSRWLVGTNAGAETGANAGSNFSFLRYSDAGAFLGGALTIVRATGEAIFSGALTGTSATFSSSVGIGAAPNAVTQLDVASTTKGVRFSPMTTTQRNAITAIDGLQIYNTTLGEYQYYQLSSTTWKAMAAATGAGTVNTGAINTLAYYPAAGTTVDDLAAITASRALASNANGLPVASTTTATELGYVNGVTSSIQTQLGTKANDAGVVHIAGTETITGGKTFTSRMLVGDGTFTADITGILVSRNSTTAGEFSHGFRDESTINATGSGAFASFDAIPLMTGAGTFNHLRGFQSRLGYTGTGSVSEVQPFDAELNHTGTGIITNAHMVKIYKPTGIGPITNLSGIHIDDLAARGTTTYAIYSAGASPSYFGGAIQSGGLLTGTTATFTSISGTYGQILAVDASGGLLGNPNLTIISGVLDMKNATTSKILASASNLSLESTSGSIVTNTGVGIGAAPNGSTQLDVVSTTKGVRFTPMTTTQRNTLTAIDGLQVYNTTTGQYEYYQSSSTSWKSMLGGGGAYLPLTGGTLTGALTGTSATFSDNVNLTNAGGGVINNATGNLFIQKPASGGYIFRNGSPDYTEYIRVTNVGNFLLGTSTDAGYKLDVNGTGRFSGALTGTSATFSGYVDAGTTDPIRLGLQGGRNGVTNLGNTDLYLWCTNVHNTIIGANNAEGLRVQTDQTIKIATLNDATGVAKMVVTTNGVLGYTTANVWTELKLTTDVTTTGQTLVDITGLVTGTLPNSTRYEIEVVLNVSTSVDTDGTRYAISTAGTGAAGLVSVIVTATGGTNAVTGGTIDAPNQSAGNFLLGSNTRGVVLIKGFVTTTGTGVSTISIQHLKFNAGTSTIKAGSVFKYRLA